MNICFIGGGNMASALMGGLLQQAEARHHIYLTDPSTQARERVLREYGVSGSADLPEDVGRYEVIVLAVKPQVMPAVLSGLAAQLAQARNEQQGEQQCSLVLSVAAGITTGFMRRSLGADCAVIRAMPNTPALLGAGISGLFAPEGVGQQHRQAAESIMQAGGPCIWVNEEALLDVVTAVSGSGPAYYYLLTEALQKAGQALGLPPGSARELAVHTAHGAGLMALNASEEMATLRQRVTSPGGTTQAAIEHLQQGGFEALVMSAVEAATKRGRALAQAGASA